MDLQLPSVNQTQPKPNQTIENHIKCGLCLTERARIVTSCGCFYCLDCHNNAKCFNCPEKCSCLICDGNVLFTQSVDINDKQKICTFLLKNKEINKKMAAKLFELLKVNLNF